MMCLNRDEQKKRRTMQCYIHGENGTSHTHTHTHYHQNNRTRKRSIPPTAPAELQHITACKEVHPITFSRKRKQLTTIGSNHAGEPTT